MPSTVGSLLTFVIFLTFGYPMKLSRLTVLDRGLESFFDPPPSVWKSAAAQ